MNRKPVQRYTCLFSKCREFASMKIEAKSDRAAVRIAAGYRFREVGYLTPVLRLENVLRFNPASGAFEGQRALEIEVARLNRRRRSACVTLDPLDVALLGAPLVPLVEEANEVCA